MFLNLPGVLYLPCLSFPLEFTCFGLMKCEKSLVSFEIIEQAWKIISTFSKNRVLQTPGGASWAGGIFYFFFSSPVAGSCLEKWPGDLGYSKLPSKTAAQCRSWSIPCMSQGRQQDSVPLGLGWVGGRLPATWHCSKVGRFTILQVWYSDSFCKELFTKRTFPAPPPPKVCLFQMSQIKGDMHLCRGYLEMCSYV